MGMMGACCGSAGAITFICSGDSESGEFGKAKLVWKESDLPGSADEVLMA